MTRQGKVGSVLLLGLFWMWLSLGGAISADGIECTWGDAKVASVSQFHPKETSDGRGRSEASKDQFALGDTIEVKVADLAALFKYKKCLDEADTSQLHPIILYLDGQPIESEQGILVGKLEAGKPGILRFTLDRSTETRDAWVSILGRPTFGPRTVLVSVGAVDQYAIDRGVQIRLDVIPTTSFIVAALLVLAALVVFIILLRRSNIIRDARFNPETQRIEPGMWSLSRAQAAWWFFIILAAYFFIAIVTWEFEGTLNETALILLAIGGATAVGSSLIGHSKGEADAQKVDKAKSEAEADIQQRQGEVDTLEAAVKALPEYAYLESATGAARVAKDNAKRAVDAASAALNAANIAADQARITATTTALSNVRTQFTTAESNLERLEKPQRDLEAARRNLAAARERLNRITEASRGFFYDILSDADGVSFHRFQMLVWTIGLSGVFIFEVWRNLAMPDFGAVLLGLQGISAATYLGLKVSEPDLPPG